MPHLNIKHTAEYAYRYPISLLRHRLQMRSYESRDFRLRSAKLSVEPGPADIRWARDVLGNSACIQDWAAGTGTILPRGVLAQQSAHYPSIAATPDPGAESLPFSHAGKEIEDLRRITERRLPYPDGLVAGRVHNFLSGSASPQTLGLLPAMAQSIQHSLGFAARDAGGKQTSAATLTMGSGTCREFAKLMMEAAHSLGLAARSVTGYLSEAGALAARVGGAIACLVRGLPSWRRLGRVWSRLRFAGGRQFNPCGSGTCAVSGASGSRSICECPTNPKGLWVDITVAVIADTPAHPGA